jgi:oligopeptide/dipeptide ABC transporter ATP-binding protein
MIVMYAGRMAETGPVQQVIDDPHHPYTKGLITCVPHLLAQLTEERPPLAEIGGIVPALKDFGQNACLFASRCNRVNDQCLAERPPEVAFTNGQLSACWQAEDV